MATELPRLQLPQGPPFPDPREVLPHKEPFLFIDQVVELSERRCVAVRTFRPDENFFKGHFPGRPVVPGVLLLEGLAQTMAYLALVQQPAGKVFLVGIDRARFRSIVEPGQEVTFEVEAGELRFGLLTGKGKVRTAAARIADAALTGYSGDPGGNPLK